MLRIVCPSCQARLNAKEKLLGQTRNCPKCGHPVLIEAPDETSEASPETVEASGGEVLLQTEQAEALPRTAVLADPPRELGHGCQYLILDPHRIVATWEANGLGWQLQTAAGPVSASRNTEELPARAASSWSSCG